MLADILGADVVEIVGVDERCEFFRDLQMGSIQIVALAEKLNAAHGAQADLVAWLSRKPMRALARLTVGQVADFIANADH
jgi:hypothetical protein